MEPQASRPFDRDAAFGQALSLFRDLVRIDTTNPPGNEEDAALLLADWLSSVGLCPKLFRAGPRRASVVCRLKGTGELAPLLLHSHLDVVPAEPDAWRYPPFSAELADGFVWGRGTVDVKNFVATTAVVLKCLKDESLRLKRDVILVAAADEETGGSMGSRFLVTEHPDEVRAEIGLGELGGIPMFLASTCFYLVGVAEKGWARVRLIAGGDPGHGALGGADSALVRLARVVAELASSRLPQVLIPAVDRFLSHIQRALPFPKSLYVPLMKRPAVANYFIRRNFPRRELVQAFAAMLSDTATPTVFSSGSKVNVVSSKADAELDCRILPGRTVDDLVDELKAVVGPSVDLEVLEYLPPLESPLEGPVLEAIARALSIHHPGAVPIPYLNPGATDAKHFSTLGTHCYGFTPIRFERESKIEFNRLIHGHDERIPVEGFRWGLNVFHQVVRDLALG